MKKLPCRIKKHMTVSTLDGEKCLIFNYSCIPHGIWRKAFRSYENRQESIDEHVSKKNNQGSNKP